MSPNKRELRHSAVLMLAIFLGVVTIAPFAAAITKEQALEQFVEGTITDDASFSPTTVEEGSGAGSVEASHYGADLTVNFFKKSIGNETEFENWILDQQLTSGGFRDIEGGAESVKASFHAVSALEITGKQARIDNKLVTYLDSCRKDNEAWANTPNGDKCLTSTYHALESYHTYLGNLSYVKDDLGMTEKVTQYTLSCYNDDGGFGSTVNGSSTLEATYAALQILELLNASDSFTNQEKVQAFVLSLKNQDPNYADKLGSFHEAGEEEGTLYATYYASLILNYLGNSSDPNGWVKSWIVSRQNRADGGFVEPVESELNAKSSLISSFYAVRALVVYNPDMSSLKKTDWDLEFDWVPLVVIIVVLVAVIVVGVWIWKRRRL
ncbi:MAG: prenyltransferase/squalene oxidase repeat-containing protein [Promethearchaeota archaeon]